MYVIVKENWFVTFRLGITIVNRVLLEFIVITQYYCSIEFIICIIYLYEPFGHSVINFSKISNNCNTRITQNRHELNIKHINII